MDGDATPDRLATRPSPALRIPDDGVVDETIDGEVIIVQLERGNYFSLTGSGSEIWAALARGLTIERIAESLGERYGQDPSQLAAVIGALADELQAEGLLEPREGTATVDPAGSASRPGDELEGIGVAEGFQPPKLEKFTDMQDFLLVDPIHEVTGEGWPATKKD